MTRTANNSFSSKSYHKDAGARVDAAVKHLAAVLKKPDPSLEDICAASRDVAELVDLNYLCPGAWSPALTRKAAGLLVLAAKKTQGKEPIATKCARRVKFFQENASLLQRARLERDAFQAAHGRSPSL